MMDLEGRFPISNWPTHNGVYELLQVRIEETVHLVFGESEDHDQESVLERFLASKGIEQTQRGNPRALYEVIGAGSAIITPSLEEAGFYEAPRGAVYNQPLNWKFLPLRELLKEGWTTRRL